MLLRDFLDGLYEHKKIFVILLAISVVLCSLKLKLDESYTAEILIKYIGAKAEDGLAENGKKINPYEIKSSIVIKNALTELGFKTSNIEEISRNITVTPIIPTAEQEKYASWIDKFSDYEKNEDEKKNTVYYSVKFTTPKGNDYAKRMLSAVFSQYRLYYVENYTYSYDITNLSGEAAMQYDYYETVDMLRRKTKSNINYLAKVSESEKDYRSPRTGYSLLDLIAEYKSLTERDLSVAERMVIENGITKNAWYLRNTLHNKMTDAAYDVDLNNKKAETQKGLMTIYSDKNKQYLWDRDGRNKDEDDSESTQVRENTERDENYVQNKSVYDQLVLDYVNYRTTALNTEIDRQHYETDANSFSDEFSDKELQKVIETSLQNTCKKFNELYSLTKATIGDYNFYKSAQSIACISGVVAHKTASTMFYYAVSFVLALMFGFLICGVLVYIKKNETEAAGE